MVLEGAGLVNALGTSLHSFIYITEMGIHFIDHLRITSGYQSRTSGALSNLIPEDTESFKPCSEYVSVGLMHSKSCILNYH